MLRQDALPSPAPPQSRLHPMAALDLSDLRAIVVDDSLYMCRLIRTMLYSFGVREVREAHDGAEALEQLNTNAIDFMVLDWEMPVLDGAELVRLIRKPDHPMAYLPIIVLTGYSTENRAREAMRLGVNDILLKPCSPKALYERLADCIVNPRPFVRNAGYFGPRPRTDSANSRSGPAPLEALDFDTISLDDTGSVIV